MLVLSRKTGESIICDNNIEIKILNITGNRVRIGISAPNEISIKRAEMKSVQEFEINMEKQTVSEC